MSKVSELAQHYAQSIVDFYYQRHITLVILDAVPVATGYCIALHPPLDSDNSSLKASLLKDAETNMTKYLEVLQSDLMLRYPPRIHRTDTHLCLMIEPINPMLPPPSIALELAIAVLERFASPDNWGKTGNWGKLKPNRWTGGDDPQQLAADVLAQIRGEALNV